MVNELLEKKKRAFDALDILEQSSDDEPDLGRKASEDALKQAAIRQQQKQQQAIPKMAQKLARTVSDDISALSELSRADFNPPPHSTNPSKGKERANDPPSSTDPHNTKGMPKPLLRKTVSDIITVPSNISMPAKVTGKRKREPATRLVPDALRVFRDLHMYFFPNNDSAPARKMRIAKACEYGATWHKEWDAQVTHVIMDKSMNFEQLMKWLKLEKLPDHVIVVNENYLAECISYGVLLDPSVSRFAVKGLALSRADSTESDTSLKLKATKTAQTYQTPPKEQVPDFPVSAVVTDKEVAGEPAQNTSSVGQSLPTVESDGSKELDEAIQRAKALQDIHIDEDGDSDGGSDNNSLGNHSGDEEKRAGLKLLAKRKGKVAKAQDKWQCMQKNTGDSSQRNPNASTIDILQQMADYYGQTGDEWRIRAYRKAIATLRNHTMKVSTKEEAGALPNIGPRLAEKIEEIVFTRGLRRLDNAKAEPTDQVLQTFMGVYGAGIKQASEWVNAGYRTLDELVEKASLTPNQQIGVAHYEDFATRIPRSEVEKHGSMVRTALQKLDPSFEVIIGGSYRRGAKDSGDIDCIITRPDTGAAHLRNTILGQLVPQLTESGFLVANLAMTSKDDGSKWHGASCLPGSKIWRRMDLLLVPSDEMGAALIYFTGNDIFNRSLRLLASTKGMRLNQRGLYKDVMRGKNREKLCEGTLVEGKDEKKIFEALNVPWRPPEHRIC